MQEGIDFFISYAPVADITSIHILLAIAAANNNMVIYIIDITNAFQNNIITNPNE